MYELFKSLEENRQKVKIADYILAREEKIPKKWLCILLNKRQKYNGNSVLSEK